MFRRIITAAALAFGLSGCITVYEYGGADAETDDYYYSEPSIDRYDYGYGPGYGPYHDRYFHPDYDRFGYRRYDGWSGSWFGSVGYRFGDGAFGGYGFPYWYFGYGYGYGFPYHDPFWRHRYYGDPGYYHRPPSHRPPTHRPPTQRPNDGPYRPAQYPSQRRQPQLADREAPRQGIGRPVPEISTAPRVLNGSMPRVRPPAQGIPTPNTSAPVVMSRPSPSYRTAEPRAEAPPPAPRPMPMPARRIQQNEDAPMFRPSPAPQSQTNRPEREPGHEPR